MLLDRKKFSGFGDIDHDLIQSSEKELLHKCMVAEQSISDGDFSVDEALEAYGLSKEQYDSYVAKKSKSFIFLSLSGNKETYATIKTSFAVPHVIDIYIEMLDSSFDDQLHFILKDRIGRIKSELEGISSDVKKLKTKA